MRSLLMLCLIIFTCDRLTVDCLESGEPLTAEELEEKERLLEEVSRVFAGCLVYIMLQAYLLTIERIISGLFFLE